MTWLLFWDQQTSNTEAYNLKVIVFKQVHVNTRAVQ